MSPWDKGRYDICTAPFPILKYQEVPYILGVGTAQHLSQWESQDWDLTCGRKKHPQKTGQWHTRLYTYNDNTPERGGRWWGLGWLAFLSACCCACFSEQQSKPDGNSSLAHYTQFPKSAALFSNLTKAVSASILCTVAKQLTAKTLGCSVSKRQCGAGSQGSMGGNVQRHERKIFICRDFQ